MSEYGILGLGDGKLGDVRFLDLSLGRMKGEEGGKRSARPETLVLTHGLCAGCTSFEHKAAAALHAIMLETAADQDTMSEYTRQVIAVISDQGHGVLFHPSPVQVRSYCLVPCQLSAIS